MPWRARAPGYPPPEASTLTKRPSVRPSVGILASPARTRQQQQQQQARGEPESPCASSPICEKVVQPDGAPTDEVSAPDGTALAATTALDVPAERRRDEEELSELAVRSRELLAETRATHLATRRAAESSRPSARATTEGRATHAERQAGEAGSQPPAAPPAARGREYPPQMEGTAPAEPLGGASACGAGGAIVGAASGRAPRPPRRAWRLLNHQ